MVPIFVEELALCASMAGCIGEERQPVVCSPEFMHYLDECFLLFEGSFEEGTVKIWPVNGVECICCLALFLRNIFFH